MRSKKRRNYAWCVRTWSDDPRAALNHDLDELIERIFASGLSDQKISEVSGLSVSCIHNIRWRITAVPMYSSVFALAEAVGLRSVYTPATIRLTPKTVTKTRKPRFKVKTYG